MHIEIMIYYWIAFLSPIHEFGQKEKSDTRIELRAKNYKKEKEKEKEKAT